VPKTDLLLITPPFIQTNSPYPATPALKGFLNLYQYRVEQLDLSIECLLQMLSKKGLTDIFQLAEQQDLSGNAADIYAQKDQYIRYIDGVVSFLQGKYQTFAYNINNGILPEAGRFNIQQDLEWHFGTDGILDKARFLATLFIEDLGDFIAEAIDTRFGFSRYAERIALNITDFSDILDSLATETYITKLMYSILRRRISETKPAVIGFTIPFPGNFLMALKSAQYIKKHFPDIKIMMGGGYVNTELRLLNEPRLFHFTDFVCLDDGELTTLKILDYIINNKKDLVRTFCLNNGNVEYYNNSSLNDFAHNNIGTPDFSGLPVDKYFSVAETTNAMHNMWTNGYWNKMTLAHGCYWHKCSFCDTSLDYIRRYSGASAVELVNRIESIIEQTNHRGFHFTDEAAPPALLKKLAKELISREVTITWWTNIRFESAFDGELCELLAASGCIAVSGGLEVASDRLLKKMNKGVTLETVAKASASFQQAGIMIHAYLMYGFPTQTAQEIIDSLEVVRQMFELGLINSGFWHQFAMTVHSPVGINPETYGVKRLPLPTNVFAQNGCEHVDPTNCRYEDYSEGLSKSLYNFIHNIGIDMDLSEWFNFKVPRTQIPRNFVEKFFDFS
jgi:radical SAM superfamily enzyme YgiQ (UPF0313 family)